jgi:hypothetical protein
MNSFSGMFGGPQVSQDELHILLLYGVIFAVIGGAALLVMLTFFVIGYFYLNWFSRWLARLPKENRDAVLYGPGVPVRVVNPDDLPPRRRRRP